MDNAPFGINLVNKTMLNIDSPRIAASQISNKLFKTRRRSKRIRSKHVKNDWAFDFGPDEATFFASFCACFE